MARVNGCPPVQRQQGLPLPHYTTVYPPPPTYDPPLPLFAVIQGPIGPPFSPNFKDRAVQRDGAAKGGGQNFDLTGSRHVNAWGMAGQPLSKHNRGPPWSLLFCWLRRRPATRPSGQRWRDPVPPSPRPMLPNMHSLSPPPPLPSCSKQQQRAAGPWSGIPNVPGGPSKGRGRAAEGVERVVCIVLSAGGARGMRPGWAWGPHRRGNVCTAGPQRYVGDAWPRVASSPAFAGTHRPACARGHGCGPRSMASIPEAPSGRGPVDGGRLSHVCSPRRQEGGQGIAVPPGDLLGALGWGPKVGWSSGAWGMGCVRDTLARHPRGPANVYSEGRGGHFEGCMLRDPSPAVPGLPPKDPPAPRQETRPRRRGVSLAACLPSYSPTGDS